MNNIIYALVVANTFTEAIAAFRLVDTGGRFCSGAATSLHVAPGDEEACKTQCQGLGRWYCMYDYGTNDGFCMATDACPSLIMPHDARRYRVWAVVPEPVFTWTAPNDTFTFTGQQCMARDEGMAADLPLGGQSYTIEAWVKPEGGGGGRGFVGWGPRWIANKGQGFRMGDAVGEQGAGYLSDYWWANDMTATLPYSMADGAWHHVASTWDGTTGRIFLDFSLVAETPRSNRQVDTKENFCVGAHSSAEDNSYFKGSMCVLRIWKVARGVEDMKQGAACTSTTTSTTVTTATATKTTTTTTMTMTILHSIVNSHFGVHFIPKVSLNTTSCPKKGLWRISNVAPYVVTLAVHMGHSKGWRFLGHLGYGLKIAKFGGPSFTWRLVGVGNATFTVQNGVEDNSGNSYLTLHPSEQQPQLESSAEEERARWLIRGLP